MTVAAAIVVGAPRAMPTQETADCERRDDWGLEQDVNAWSSLGYVLVGIVLAWEIHRARLPRAVWGLAVAAAAEGIGSLLYHGQASDVGQFLHDVPLVAALGYVAGWHAGRVVGAARGAAPRFADRAALIGLTIGALASAAIWAWAPGRTNVAVGAAVTVVAIASLLARRRGLTGVWTLPLLLLGAIAIATWALGSADSPICDGDAWLQPHGGWHLLTAVLTLAWVDSAYGALRPDDPPQMFRRFIDRTIGLVARGLVLAFHRSVDVTGRERLPRDRPVLIVANHGNGFVDPVVVAGVLGRLPRFLAKAALWKVPVARPLLALAGVLPVHRTADGDRASNNRSVFEACHRELAIGAKVAIFPEGTTGDRAGLDRVKSGAARIALGGLPAAPDLVIAPIGLAFESRIETRGRAVVMFGEPIVVAEYATGGILDDGEPDHHDVHTLTNRITDALEQVSPGFASVDEREILRAAAREERAAVVGRSPRFGESEIVARQMAVADDQARAAVIDAYREFATRLELIGVRSVQLRARRISLFRLALSAVALFFAGSLLLTVTLFHLPAIAVVVIGTALVRSTATKGTVRLLLGLATLLATWILAGMWLADGWAAVATGIGVAIGGIVALVVWPPLLREAEILVGRVRMRDRVGLLPPVVEARARVVEAVRACVGGDHVR